MAATPGWATLRNQERSDPVMANTLHHNRSKVKYNYIFSVVCGKELISQIFEMQLKKKMAIADAGALKPTTGKHFKMTHSYKPSLVFP